MLIGNNGVEKQKLKVQEKGNEVNCRESSPRMVRGNVILIQMEGQPYIGTWSPV